MRIFSTSFFFSLSLLTFGQSNHFDSALHFMSIQDHVNAIKNIEKWSAQNVDVTKIYQDPIFRPLFYNPDTRSQLSLILSRNPADYSLDILDPKEIGDRIEVSGKVLLRDGSPASNAEVYFFSVDHEGLYAPEHRQAGHGSNNPRLFGYVRSNEEGAFQITTIRPVSYIGLNTIRHIHYKISLPLGRSKEGEFIFSNDPQPSERQYRWAKNVGFQIVDEIRVGATYSCEVTIKI